MKTRIKTVLENKEATARDYFNLINVFDYSALTLYKDHSSIFNMEVNSFDGETDTLTFYQKYADTKYCVSASDIESVEAKMLGELDTFFIGAKMVNGFELNIYIYNTDTNTKTTVCERYYDIDVYYLKDYLENKSHPEVSHKPMMAVVKDCYGLEVKLSSLASAYIDEDEEGLTLHIQDGMTSEISLPLVDDSCNEVYIKEGGSFDSILIKPYGQSFMEIVMIIHNEEVKPKLTIVK